jgi:hypothetical protein
MRYLFNDVSIFQVIKLESANVLSAIGQLSGCASDWSVRLQLINSGHSVPVYLPEYNRIWFLKSLERIRDSAKELEMIASSAAAERAYSECLVSFSQELDYNALELQKIISHAEKVVQNYSDEMRAKLVFVMPSKHATYYVDSGHFGETVENAFPSVVYDVTEAAACRSLGRWTACVMHVMRVLEIGLRALAEHFDVEADKNWNAVLNQIEVKVRETGKLSHGKDAEQWAAEAATHLRFIKNAWRNHAMHPLEKYDEERAVAIFDNARSFMLHLAGKLAE